MVHTTLTYSSWYFGSPLERDGSKAKEGWLMSVVLDYCHFPKNMTMKDHQLLVIILIAPLSIQPPLCLVAYNHYK